MKLRRETIKRLIREELKKINEGNSGIDPDISEYIDKVYENILGVQDLNRDKPQTDEIKYALSLIRELRSNVILAMMSNDFEPKHLDLKERWDLVLGKFEDLNGADQMPGYQKVKNIIANYEDQTKKQRYKYYHAWQNNVVHARPGYRTWDEIPRDIYTKGMEYLDAPPDARDELEKWFVEVHRGLLKDEEETGKDRAAKIKVVEYFQRHVYEISKGEELDLGPWHQHIGQYWEKGGIYNDGLQDMPGYKLFQQYKKKIGPQAQVAYANK